MTAIHHFWLGASPYSAVVVSGLFPAFEQDSFSAGLAPSGGTLVEMPRPLDEMAASLSLGPAALETILIGAQDLGALSSGISIQSGTLVGGLQSLTYPEERMSSGLSLQGGTLVLGLISTTYPTEGVSAALGINSGTLV